MVKFKEIRPMLKTTDLWRTIDFYTQILGSMVGCVWPEDNHTFCILEHGDVHVSFYVDTDQREPDPAFTGQLYIGVEDVMGLHARIVDKVKIEWGPEVYHYGRREFAIRDCNGYILSFSEPTDEPPTCHED